MIMLQVNNFISKNMCFFKRKKRVRTDRATSSEKWRQLVYDKLKNCAELKPLLSENVLSIYELFITHDTAINRTKVANFIHTNNVAKLKALQGKFPFDFDEVDYPVLQVVLVKKLLASYIILLAQDGKFQSISIVEIFVGKELNKDDFITRALIYPV